MVCLGSLKFQNSLRVGPSAPVGLESNETCGPERAACLTGTRLIGMMGDSIRTNSGLFAAGLIARIWARGGSGAINGSSHRGLVESTVPSSTWSKVNGLACPAAADADPGVPLKLYNTDSGDRREE